MHTNSALGPRTEASNNKACIQNDQNKATEETKVTLVVVNVEESQMNGPTRALSNEKASPIKEESAKAL